MIVGTAGHVDHGKTSLVKALTGVDADRLKEEKERGITIDLGFAYWPRPEGGTIGFVDVPGHEKFVHTMMAGAQGVDLAMMVVAADDGVMPQTTEHLEVLDLLGVERGIVVMTKVDAVAFEHRERVRDQIADAFRGTLLDGAPVVEVSTVTGEGIQQLTRLLDAETSAPSSRALDKTFRLAIDRCFSLKGTGVVVTGMVLDGEIPVGAEVTISPSGLSARVRGIHAQNRRSERAIAGQRCALNLAGSGVEVASISRGDVVTVSSGHAPSRRIDATIAIGSGADRGLRQWMPGWLHHGTTEVGARVVLIEDAETGPGREILVQLVLDRPIAARALDRYVLRDASGSRTLGGGRFLDLRAPDRRRRTPDRIRALAALREQVPERALDRLLQGAVDPIDLDVFAVDRGAEPEASLRWVAATDGICLQAERRRYAMSRARLSEMGRTVEVALGEFHAASPDLAGVGLDRLRSRVAPRLSGPQFRAAAREFASQGWFVLEGAWGRLATHTVGLSATDEGLWVEIEPGLAGSSRFRTPRVRDVATSTSEPEEGIRGLFKRLGRAAKLDEIAQDHFFLRGSVAEAVDVAADVEAAAGGWFAAAHFRDALEARGGTIVGRKVAMQILEFLDRQGVTVRRGDLRRINPRRRGLFAADGGAGIAAA